MNLGHTEPASPDAGTLAAVAVVALAVAGYLTAAIRRGREPRGWSGRRTVSFVAGGAVLIAGLLPLSPFPPGDFRGHAYQHLLIGMYAPLGLVLAAPVTLLLRSLPPRHRRPVVRVLRSRPVHLLASPVTALALAVGALWLLYLTPLYPVTVDHQVAHHLTHLHFFAAGCLFVWVVAGPDPAPRRASVPARLVALGVAVAAHATLAQLMYAGALIRVPAPAEQLRGGGELMYYFGDLAEILLALALLSTWRPRTTPITCAVSR